MARAALRPDGLNAVLQELERQLGCWVALFDAAGYRVPTATRLAIPNAVADEVSEAVRAALGRGTRGGVRISTAETDITLQTLGPHAALQGVLAVGTRTRLNAAEHDLVTSVIALASIALDQSRMIEDARRHLRSGLLQLDPVRARTRSPPTRPSSSAVDCPIRPGSGLRDRSPAPAADRRTRACTPNATPVGCSSPTTATGW